MKQITRNGELIEKKDTQERILQVLYQTIPGRLCLKFLVNPWISNIVGRFLSCKISRILIRPFITRYGISLDAYETQTFTTYNEFFSRKIRPEMRPIDLCANHLISPCDSKLTVVPIRSNCSFTLKNTRYTVKSLLKNKELALKYQGGYALIFRLTVDDYHRYCYIADGEKEENISIPGVLHTVNPIANDLYPIYKENAREYTILHTKEFNDIIIIEIGALLVGKIVNHHKTASVLRGQEKGYFQFGGSTIVLLFQENTIQMDEDILLNSKKNIETIVKYGEKIGEVYK